MHTNHPCVRFSNLLAGMVVVFFMATPAAQDNARDDAQRGVQTGMRLMADGSKGNCIACHALSGVSGTASTFGPPLAKVGERYSAAQLRQWVTDARKIKPDTLMPPFGTTDGTQQAIRKNPMLTEDEITQVTLALQALR